MQIICPRCRVAHQPIARGESHSLYGDAERDSDLRAACRSSDCAGLPPIPFQVGPNQIQARQVVAAELQTEFVCCDADCLPSARGESHFLYEYVERDSDLRAACRSSDSGGLPSI